MAIVLTDDKHYKAIAGVLREAIGIPSDSTDFPYRPSEMSGAIETQLISVRDEGHNTGYAEGMNEGYGLGYSNGKGVGKKEAYNTFWSVLQNNGGEAVYYYAFCYDKYTDENYNPQYDIVCKSGATTSSQYIFNQATQITDTKVAIYANGNSATGMFNGCENLHTIRKLVVHKNLTYSNAFNGCSALANIVIEGEIGNNIDLHWSTNLTRDSIESIINHLSGETSGKTLTLSEEAVNKAFETSEGANDGTNSIEWIFFPNNWNLSFI